MLSKLMAFLVLMLHLSLGVCARGRELIELYGDSTQIGVDGAALVGNPSNVRFVTDPIESYIDVDGYIISNFGISGESTKSVLDGKWTKISWEKMAYLSCATIVVFNHGINDTILISKEEYATNLRKIAEISRMNGKDIIFQTPNPSSLPNVAAYADVMRIVARKNGIPIIDVYAYISSLIGDGKITEYMPDGVHPSQSTYTKIGSYLQTRLREILGVRQLTLTLLPIRASRQLQEGAFHPFSPTH